MVLNRVGDFGEIIKLFLMRPVAALDMAIELGTAGWQGIQVDPLRLTRALEGRLKLRAPIDLDGAHRKAKAGKFLRQHPGGRGGSAALRAAVKYPKASKERARQPVRVLDLCAI